MPPGLGRYRAKPCAHGARGPFCAGMRRASLTISPSSLGLLLLLKLLDLAALTLDLALLIFDLVALLLRTDFLVLQRIADHVSGAGAKHAADRRAGARMADRRADYRS